MADDDEEVIDDIQTTMGIHTSNSRNDENEDIEREEMDTGETASTGRINEENNEDEESEYDGDKEDDNGSDWIGNRTNNERYFLISIKWTSTVKPIEPKVFKQD